jgi:cytochrome c-type biogenesis protein
VRPVRASQAAAFMALVGLSVGAAVVVARLGAAGAAGIAGSVEALSSTSSALLDRFATLLPFGFAFGAGMVSAANPCGFAMLPAYLALFVSTSVGGRGQPVGRLRRALLVSVAVTAGFILLFAVVGITIAAGARWLAGSFPWLGLATGVLLVLAGAWSAVGGTFDTGFWERLWHSSSATSGSDTDKGARDFFAFGLAYGLASLSCTLPVFLAVLGSTLTLSTIPATVLQLLLYGLGMGVVVTLLTLSVAAFQGAIVGRIRQAGRYVAPLGSVLLLLAGSYIVYYWLTVGGLLAAFV